MNKKITTKLFLNSIVLSVLTLSLSLFAAVGGVFATNPQFNIMSNDKETLRVGNWTTNGGTTNWSDPISANPGDRVAFDVYYHNGVSGTTATNTRMKITYSTSASSPISVTGALWADNAAQVSDSGTINIGSAQTLTFENIAKWYPNQQVASATDMTVTRVGNSVEVNIGNVAGGWPTQGHVVFYANISNTSTNHAPTVNAGPDISVNENQSIGMSASASDQDGNSLTYSWSCTGGSLSSSTSLNPTYYAPSVTSDTTYNCTLNVNDGKGGSASDSVSIRVLNVAAANHAPTVYAGPDITMNENQSVVMAASASDPDGDSLTYSWTCNGGSKSSTTVLNPTYYAPSVTSDTTYICTLTVTDSHGASASDSLSIRVKNVCETNHAPTVYAGPDITMNENQSVVMAASASDPDGDSLTYSWTCNGGSKSSTTVLNPTYYAPSVTSDTTYNCTLTVSDGKGGSASDSLSIRVLNVADANHAPTVYAGPDVTVNENQSIGMSASASDQDGDSLTYSWTCTVGSLSSSTSLNPTYYAPSVTSDTTYNCTLNVNDGKGGSASDSVSIRVLNVADANHAPTVYAGPDVTVNENQSIGMSASASDQDGDSLTYSWTCTGGSLSSSTSLNPTYYAPSVSYDTIYNCTFSVNDGRGGFASDSVSINVVNSADANHAPTVYAGPDVTVNENQSIGMSATASDQDGDSLTYSWTCTGGSLSSSTSLNPTYYAPSVTSDTTYNCTLSVTDNRGGSASDSVSINVVNSADANHAPTVYAGPDVTVNENQSIGMSASASDQDGDSLTYSWTCTGGSLSSSTSLNPTYYAPSVTYNTIYNCTFSVNDGRGGFASDSVSINVVNSADANHAPTVYAGPDVTVNENQSIGMSATASDQDGDSLTYSWTCTGGSLSSSTSLNPTYYAPSVSYDTTYTCTLTVYDNRGGSASDSVNITSRNTQNPTGLLSITTNNATNITGVSATLNGTLNNSGGQNASVRFNWGRLSSYSNSTPWLPNRYSGQSFNYLISGLEKGKAYHYRAEAEANNGGGVVTGQDIAFITKPDAPTGFIALGNYSGQINLSWVNGTGSCYTMVVRKRGGYPINSDDGAMIYYGNNTSFVDTNLYNNVWYYYKAWSVACDEGMRAYSVSTLTRAYTTSGYIAPPVVKEPESKIVLDVLAKNISQNDFSCQIGINANPGDEIEFKVIITPVGGKSLQNVILRTSLSDKIESVNSITINNEYYNGSLNGDINLGSIALGGSKTIIFKGKIASKESFSYSSNELISTFEVSANDAVTTTKTLKINVAREVEAGAGLISFINWKYWPGILIGLFLLLLLIMFLTMMYLLIDRKREKERLAEQAALTKVEKSKYFNIK
jgi:hypothetical protein